MHACRPPGESRCSTAHWLLEDLGGVLHMRLDPLPLEVQAHVLRAQGAIKAPLDPSGMTQKHAHARQRHSCWNPQWTLEKERVCTHRPVVHPRVDGGKVDVGAGVIRNEVLPLSSGPGGAGCTPGRQP